LTVEPLFWYSWKGKILRAVVLDGVYEKSEMLKKLGLSEIQLETALNELLEAELLNHNKDKSRFWSNSKELSNEYREFLEKIQESLIDWLYNWRRQKRINTELNHFFLEDKLLDELSEKLIEHANVDVLVTNPYVERCHLSNTLTSAIAKGTRVRLVTRSPTSERYHQIMRQKYHSKLKEEGVSITYDDSVHAKLIVVDRAVATVSSMNFVVSSSGGASYEAGLVTVERNVVQSVARSIINRL